MGGKNQTSFKKGEVHNPKGRPKKGMTWGDLYETVLAEDVGNGKMTLKEALVRASSKEALKDPRFLRIIQDRMEGRPKEQIEHSGSVGLSPLDIVKKNMEKE